MQQCAALSKLITIVVITTSLTYNFFCIFYSFSSTSEASNLIRAAGTILGGVWGTPREFYSQLYTKIYQT